MYTQSAHLYDLIHNFKNYETEAEHIHLLIQTMQRRDSHSLLDIGCGTGQHLAFLKEYYQLMGLDMDSGLLAVATKRLPEVAFYQDDMRSFKLSRKFDVITCLFGSIAYVKTVGALRETLLNFAHHLNPGGVLLLEPFLRPEDYSPGKVRSFYRDEPHIKVARFSSSMVEENLMTAQFHYLVGETNGITYFTETHHLGLFTDSDILDGLKNAGFEDVQSPSIEEFRRGIYVAVRSLD